MMEDWDSGSYTTITWVQSKIDHMADGADNKLS